MAPQRPSPVRSFHEWELVSTIRPEEGQAPETRHYEQGELSIEGEARMLGMARKAGTILKDANFNLDALANMVNNGEPNFDLILDAVSIIVENVPALVAEASCILFGIYPTREDGSTNPEYESHLRFLRNSVNSTRFVDMLRVFAEQNDYQRLARPFWNRFRQESQPTQEAEASSSASPDSSEQGSE